MLYLGLFIIRQIGSGYSLVSSERDFTIFYDNRANGDIGNAAQSLPFWLELVQDH